MKPKGVILAAGKGSRLAPITPFLPKEMLPICGYPAIHHSLFELSEAGVTDVLVVVSSDKTALVAYLTEPIVPKGAVATKLTAERDALLSRMRISFVEQKAQNGTADAILLAEEFMGDAPLVVLYPDDLLTVCGACSDGVNATRALVHECENSKNSAILISEIPGASAREYGVVNCRPSGDGLRVVSLVEKPRDYAADVAFALIGRMILTPRTVHSIHCFDRTDESGIIPVLSHEATRGALTAVRYFGRRYDVGSHKGYASAMQELQRYSFRD